MDSHLDKLLARAQAGDKRAENELFRYLLVRFETFAKLEVGEEAAKDLAQEACITVLEKYKTERYRVSFAAWAYGVLKNKIRNYLSGPKPIPLEPEVIDQIPSPHNPPDCLLVMRLLDCLKGMIKRNVGYARVLNLVYEGYPPHEICGRLRITVGNYYVILSRGRKMLKTCLEKGGM